MTKTSKAQILASTRYRDKNCDRIEFTVPKGKKDEYKQAAEVLGIGLMELARVSIEEYLEKHLPNAGEN